MYSMFYLDEDCYVGAASGEMDLYQSKGTTVDRVSGVRQRVVELPDEPTVVKKDCRGQGY